LTLSAGLAFAANPAPNVAVIVTNSQGTAVFEGITDGTGRFVTPPLAPDLYTIELRSLKTAAPARYFLALSGARPVGQAMGNLMALKMQAQVTSTKPVTGEVRALRVVLVPASPTPAANPLTPAVTSSAPVRTTTAATASSPSATVAAPVSRPAAGPATSASFLSAARLPSSTPARPAPMSPLIHRPAVTQPRTINGQRYVWQQASPTSTLGRWVPESVPAATPSPTPGPIVPKAVPVSRSGSTTRR